MSLSLWLRRGLVAAALGVCALGSHGQTPALPVLPPLAPPPGAVPQPAELQKRALPERSTDGQVPAPPVPRELGKPGEELTLDVTAFSVDDSAPAPAARRAARLTQRFTGPDRSYEDLVNAASAVTRYLQRELGYYLGYAYLPEQAPVNGVIRIAVLEGRLDEVILNWPDKMPVERAVVEAYLARLKPGEILRVRDVERIVFLVNDLRGLNARFEVKAGRTPGTASLVVTAQPEERVTSRVEVDSTRLALLRRLARQRPGHRRQPGRSRRRPRGQPPLVVHARPGVRARRLHAAGRLRRPQGRRFRLVHEVQARRGPARRQPQRRRHDRHPVQPVPGHPLAQPQPVRPGLARQQALQRQAVRHEPEEVVERPGAVGVGRCARRPAHRWRQHLRADRAARQARLRAAKRQRQSVELHRSPASMARGCRTW